MLSALFAITALCLWASVVSPLRAEDSVVILPSKIKLTGPAARQQLLVEQFRDGHFAGQFTNRLVFASSNPNVVKIENSTVLPLTNGVATLTVKVGAQSAKVEVAVDAMEKPFEWSFRNHVQPVLAKAGCSAGACHGAAAGQNGLKLSLRGYDDDADFLVLTRQSLGRRIVPSDPGRSLMLLKPTGAVPHKGGKRFEVDSLDYRVLSDWIASGTPGPKPDEPRLERIEFLPGSVVLQPDASQQLLVRARFTDGHTEDVTHWVKYTSANQTVVNVDDNGAVQVVGHGEGAITAWYLSRIAIATVTVPYTNKVPSSAFAKARHRNFIDDLVLEKLRSLNLPPSPRCTDAEFIRRAFLDTIG
ncbi:MAG TPA: Ig-like domain-containing protein, partial [Verrucomicrobiae bacterium]